MITLTKNPQKGAQNVRMVISVEFKCKPDTRFSTKRHFYIGIEWKTKHKTNRLMKCCSVGLFFVFNSAFGTQWLKKEPGKRGQKEEKHKTKVVYIFPTPGAIPFLTLSRAHVCSRSTSTRKSSTRFSMTDHNVSRLL